MIDVIFEEIVGNQGDVGLITLNRPQFLNALTLSMCIAIKKQLQQWATASHIKAVIIRGEGERAFCAGGDIRFLYEKGRSNITEAQEFFRQEYQMNHDIFHFPKPYIALLHGITMGGGIGVSIHGSHRVAAENLVLAMPETSIGFYPDIGASYFLPRCVGKTGFYLGLMGEKINAADAQYIGLVDYLVPTTNFEALINAIAEIPSVDVTHQNVTHVINKFSSTKPSSELSKIRDLIDTCFAYSNINDVIHALNNHANTRSKQIAATLLTRSPTSLVVTLASLLKGAKQDLDACLQMELQISSHFLESHDFYEGVRAAIIDKDRNPQWSPRDISNITNQDVERFFTVP